MRDGAQYGSAEVILFDAVTAHRDATRTALGMLGFKRIFTASGIDEITHSVSQRPCDVLIADLTVESERVCKMVRDVRQGETAPNPFVVVMLTSWGVREEDANTVMGSGADDVLIRPFSVSFLAERVRTLVDARKDFIVTADYVGPNRRKNSDRSNRPGTIEVPNTLRFKAKPAEAGGVDVDLVSAVRDARSKVGELRLVGSALQMRLLAHFALLAAKDGTALEKYIVPMSAISRLLFDKLNRPSDAALASVSASLLETVAAVMQGEDVVRSLEICGGCAKAIHEGLCPDRDTSALEEEFAQAVKRLVRRGTKSVLEGASAG